MPKCKLKDSFGLVPTSTGKVLDDKTLMRSVHSSINEDGRHMSTRLFSHILLMSSPFHSIFVFYHLYGFSHILFMQIIQVYSRNGQYIYKTMRGGKVRIVTLVGCRVQLPYFPLDSQYTCKKSNIYVVPIIAFMACMPLLSLPPTPFTSFVNTCAYNSQLHILIYMASGLKSGYIQEDFISIAIAILGALTLELSCIRTHMDNC